MPRRPPVRAAVAAPPAHPADAALAAGASGRHQLPEELHAGFDAIRTAFEHAAAGRDDDARAALQPIGLSSPFLDWKLLVRGLLAYHASDDGRALDNWSRLDAGRLPARLVAPLRFVLDPNDRAAQPPKAHADLRRRADRLHGGPLPGLRDLQASLAGPHRLADAFRRAETILPTLRRDLPDLVPRLAEAFRAAIVAAGQPVDLDRYRRLFGPPADDPKFERLEALAMEERRQWHDAHESWQRYEKTLRTLPGWSPADRTRARALLWAHLGRAAAEVQAEDRKLGGLIADRRRFKPSAEQCLRKALELAPDLKEAHEELLGLYRDTNKPDKAEAAGLALLERFPDHGPTREALADLATARGDAAAAWEHLNRAAAANPLDRRLRGRLADAYRHRARTHAAAGELDAARADLAAAVALRDGRPELPTLAQAAAAAFKAGADDDAEALVLQTVAAAPAPAAALALLAEATRLKLPAKLKKRFDGNFIAALAAPPEARAAAALADVIRDQQQAGAPYLGQKTHEKKVLGYLEAAAKAATAEADLERLCAAAAEAHWCKPLRAAAQRGQRLFRANPHFPYFLAAAHAEQDGRAIWRIGPLLDQAMRLAESQPRDERTTKLLDDIAALRRRLHDDTPVFEVLNQFFSAFDHDPDWPFWVGPTMTDPYLILGLPADADDEAIRRRYLELVRRFPPEQAAERFAAVRAAYEQLRDRDARLRYRLFETGRRATLDGILEEAACRTPRRRLTLAELLAAAR